jgi:hypothetical protein
MHTATHYALSKEKIQVHLLLAGSPEREYNATNIHLQPSFPLSGLFTLD